MIPTDVEYALLRTMPQMASLRVAVYKPATCITATVQAKPNDPNGMLVPLMGITQTIPARKNYTVLVGSQPGQQDKGKLRFISLSGLGDGSILKVSKNAKLTGRVDWSSGDFITIREDVELWSILPSVSINLNNKIVTTLEDTDRPYNNQNDLIRPVLDIGGPAVAVWRGVPITFTFYADFKSMDFRDRGDYTFNWTFPGCSPSSSTSQGPIAVTVSAPGNHWVRCSCQNAFAGGPSQTRYIPIIVGEEGDTIFSNVTLDDPIDSTFESGGFSNHFTVHGWQDASQVNFRLEAYAVVFADEEYYGTTKQSIGGNHKYRENLVAVGRISHSETTLSGDPGGGDTKFTLDGINVMMKNLTVWPVSMIEATYGNGSDPDGNGWHRMHVGLAERFAWHIITEHSTLSEIADIIFDEHTGTGLTDLKLKYIDLPEQSLYDQLDQGIFSSMRGRVLFDRQGAVYFVQNPQLVPTPNRGNSEHTLLVSDLRDLPHFGVELNTDAVAQVDYISFRYGGPPGGNLGSDPLSLYSLAPANQRPYGHVEKVEGIRADNQQDSNIFAGLHDAWLNLSFKDVTLPLAGNWRIFDIAPMEYLRLPFEVSFNNRNFDFSALRWLVTGVTTTFDEAGGFILTDLHVEAESVGPPGGNGHPSSANVAPALDPGSADSGAARNPGQVVNVVTSAKERVPRCPPGQVYNPVTGLCVAPGTVVLQPVGGSSLNLSAVGVSASTVNLAWTNAPGNAGYAVERSANGTDSWTQIGTTGTDVVSYADTTGAAATRYFYRIRAMNGTVYGEYSNTADARTY